MGLSWAVFEPSWGPLGPSWGDLGGLLDRLGRCESRRGGYVKNIRFPKGMGRFLPFGALWGRRLGTSWGVLKACWAVLRPSWAFWMIFRRLGALLDRLEGLLGPSWTDLEPSWAPKKSSGILDASLPGVCRDLAGVLFVRGPPGPAPRARTRKIVYQLPEILARLWPVGPANLWGLFGAVPGLGIFGGCGGLLGGLSGSLRCFFEAVAPAVFDGSEGV